MGLNCGVKGHLARLCLSLPDPAAQTVREEGETDQESSDGGDVRGVDWEYALNNDRDEGDDIMDVGRDLHNTCCWDAGYSVDAPKSD